MQELEFIMLLKVLLQKKKKEIILSPFTIFDIVNVILCAGGIPKFSDTDLNTPHLLLNNIKKQINANTAGLLITHYHNNNPEIADILSLCKKKNIKVIEDCALSIGGKYYNSNIHLGAKSDFAIFSFGIFKTISTISGGALHVKNKLVYEKINNISKKSDTLTLTNILFKILKKVKFIIILNKYFYKIIFFNFVKYSELLNFNYFSKYLKNDPNPTIRYKIPDDYKKKISFFQLRQIQKQIKDIMNIVNSRIENAKYISELLKNNKILILPTLKKNKDTFHSYPVIVKNNQKENLYKYLLKKNFDCSKHYYRNCSSLNEFKIFGKLCENADFYAKNVLCLPCYPGIPKSYLKSLCSQINLFEKNG
jgi:dTDP-4-amino-4,6-dideoxygalactose transaminase